MPIPNHTYDPRNGESVYTLAEGEEEFTLAVEPEEKTCNRLTLWQGDRYDENNFLVAQSDPLRLSYEREREAFYGVVANVFGDKPWIREALTLISRVHQKRVEEALEKIRKQTADDPEYKALPGHEPAIYRTPEGYRIEEAPGRLVPLSNFTGRIVEGVVVDGSGETHRLFAVEARMRGRRRRFEIPAQEFEGLSWCQRCWVPLPASRVRGSSTWWRRRSGSRARRA